MNIKEGKYIIKAKHLITNLSNHKEQILFKKDNIYKAEMGNRIWVVTDELSESNTFNDHNIDGWRLDDFYKYFEVVKEDDSIELD